MCSKYVKIAYNMIVLPRLEYPSTFWNCYTIRSEDKLETVQYRAAKFVLSCHDLSLDLNVKITEIFEIIARLCFHRYMNV